MFLPNPTTLDELALLLEQAATAWEVFGDDPQGQYRRYAKLCHPDRFPDGPEQEKAGRVFRRLAEWRDIAKAAIAAEAVQSPSRRYVIARQLASGDLADVYVAVADGVPHVLKITRPSGGNPLMAVEARHLKSLCARCGDRCYREYLPNVVETFTVPGAGGARQVNVFGYREGFYTLEAVRRRHPDGLDARHLAWIFKRILAILGFTRTCGLVHGAVLPPHVMVHAENHGLQLVDWIGAVRIGGTLGFVPAAYRSWYPDEVLRKGAVTAATDIFLAARCLVYVAGGDPIGEHWPDTVPRPMRQFLDTCLYPAMRMRPQDAWELHEEFDALLGRLFGSPKYHELLMS